MKKLLIVISGGGFAQIETALGCLCALKNRGYDLASPEIDWRGTSAGGIVSTVMALGTPVETAIMRVQQTSTEELISKRWLWLIRLLFGGHIYDRSGLEKFIKSFVGDKTANNVQVMLTRQDTMAKEEMSGSYLTCLATSAIIHIFESVKINGHIYVDGGYVDNVPFEPYMLKLYEKILIILPPKDAESERHKSTVIGRLLQEVDTKISQEVNEAEHIFSQKNFYPNVTLLRPPPAKTSLLSWSDGYGLISHAYHYTWERLAKENF